VLSEGILSGVFPSGSISDYLMSMQRLHCLVVDEIYPGHGRVSRNPREDLERAIEETRLLLEESKLLFEALDTKATFERLFYSWRKFPLPRG
jgi:glyoxylase-like metal-dependent hydrolase (beta-lactamase superfamily II)